MNYPNQPYGQGFSGQPGYFQQPGWPQQNWPQQPGYPGGFQPPPRGPSGATGILAGLLALFGGLFDIFVAAIGLFSMFLSSQEEREPWMYVAVFLGFAGGLSLIVGAFSLFLRKSIARRLIVGGCTLLILFGITGLGVTLLGIGGVAKRDLDSLDTPVVAGLVVPILTLVLTMLPSTTKWIQAKPNRVAAPYYPPYHG
ncbi:hypothetical protein VST63_25785 [Mycolicibacterium sp. 050232]|uniref:hypothetical protein n=1 Tax=Mycolicibacterium sp. 050232 TaxID=3113982 RepID=UPI002E2C6A14|nr:hypothetical protein [Mycolicibacterium sp. 050232]MED5815784.1 hypothetical protein [Mycolicibacterium sp. 050232]